MSLDVAAQVLAFREMADLLELPYGPAWSAETDPKAGEHFTKVVGDRDRARALWKNVVADCGYMPRVVVDVVEAIAAENLVPDVEAPVPT